MTRQLQQSVRRSLAELGYYDMKVDYHVTLQADLMFQRRFERNPCCWTRMQVIGWELFTDLGRPPLWQMVTRELAG